MIGIQLGRYVSVSLEPQVLFGIDFVMFPQGIGIGLNFGPILVSIAVEWSD